MTNPNDVIAVAAGQLGYTETPVNCTKFGLWYGIKCAPWCAMGVSWSFAMAGMALNITTSKGFSYTPAGADYFKAQKRWYLKPQIGDLVFYKFGARIDHVELVESVNSDGSIVTLGFNTNAAGSRTGGQVARQTRRYSIVGYGRPLYSGATPVIGGDKNMIAQDSLTDGTWATDATGAVFAFDKSGAPHGRYLGGLNNHPEWKANPSSGQVIGIAEWLGDKTNAQGNGYVIGFRFNGSAAPNLYQFPGDARYA